MVPYYLENHLKNIRKSKDRVTAILTSSAGNTKLDIFYYGEIIVSKGTPFITDGKFPCLIVAKDPISGEEFTVFAGQSTDMTPCFVMNMRMYQTAVL